MEEKKLNDLNDYDSTKYLPIANIKRCIKSSFEKETDCKLSKDATDTYLEVLNEFISFITSESSKITFKDSRKTITGADLIKAFENLGFEHYTDILKKLLDKIIKQHNYCINEGGN